ncbi:C39 family peptidase [Lactobacillus sp. PV034]|uniref:C39 family peptidase n=1 Tax=Lactobacillus sp. PV034 TaxID=2594495 RepID=UPI002240ADC5|nr:C39 family peptidase [Lactobacillus sp. PV034]QNQ81069.1 hypothetical protein FP432_05610 [Lactobacillus sp. PV034]
MKTRSAMLMSALFAAGVLGVSSGNAHADTIDNSTAQSTTATTTANQNSSNTSTVNSTSATNQTAQATTNTQPSTNTSNSANTANQNKAVATVNTTVPAVKQEFTGKINYAPGYGVNLWKLNEDKSVSWIAPRRLSSGSTWKVYGYTDVNNDRLYNLGGNQWVFSKYIVNVNSKPTPSNTNNSNMTPLAKNSFVVVAYTPHYGIAVWAQNGNSLKLAGKTLPNGSAWNAFGKKNFNNKTFYNLGGNQWVDSSYVIEGTATSRYAVLKNNASSQEFYTSQYNPVFAPWGCASSALSMLMKYDGNWKNVPGTTEAQKLKYMQDHLPQNNHGGQIGNPYTGAGFKSVINSKALADYAHALGDAKIKDISGANLNTIAKLIEAGHPVLYYGWSSYDGGGNKARNHCKVIFGYNPANNTFLVHDPLYQYKHFYKGGGGQREGVYNGYDLGPISWVSYSSLSREFAYRNGNNALTIQ